MKIAVFGNINAGKSHVVQKLISLLPQYSIVQIDKMRQDYGDGSIEGEMLAQEQFISEIKNSENVIFEFTGYGEIADKLFKVLDEQSIVVLNVKTDMRICLERLDNKDFSWIPYPYEGDLKNTIETLSKVFDEQNFIHNFWSSKSKGIFDISSDDSLKDLNLY